MEFSDFHVLIRMFTYAAAEARYMDISSSHLVDSANSVQSSLLED